VRESSGVFRMKFHCLLLLTFGEEGVCFTKVYEWMSKGVTDESQPWYVKMQ
jgi:hypothetical protein